VRSVSKDIFVHITTDPLPDAGQQFNCEVWETNKTHMPMIGKVLEVEGRWYTLRLGGMTLKLLDDELKRDIILITKEMAR